MPNVRELLARLNPQTVKFDGSRGGLPELTNQDIAGALGFMPAGMGREVLIACHWPDGARLSRRRISAMFRDLALTEWRKRLNRLTEARIDHGIAVSIRRWEGRETAEQRSEYYKTQARIDQARADLWPESLPEMLPAILAAIIEEIACPRNCPSCHGRGTLIAGELVVECEDCNGTGHAKNSDGWRAKKIGKDPANFRRDWKPCYDWLFETVRDAEAEAAAVMAEKLRDEVVT
ncbi:zinc finger-like domain-containing protein [Xanthomonas albilineans]|uniref:zinc finger-like domain-containing protein n=1 Tax=Xanthomonas albilineans TaxID=29447 RepID=UPI0005F32FD8|nr:zinc finger-like domain-containing protein [Xanthomonas albilineans]